METIIIRILMKPDNVLENYEGVKGKGLIMHLRRVFRAGKSNINR